MSAPQPSPPPGGRPNGAPRPAANPLRPNRPKPKPSSIFAPKLNAKSHRPGTVNERVSTKSTSLQQGRRETNGWSEPAPQDVREFPIFTTKKALLDGVRMHLMRMHVDSQASAVDPTDQAQFARPVTLHRRDPRQPAAARTVKTEEPVREPVDQAEIEAQEQLKAEREAQKAIDQAKIAPVVREPTKPRKKVKEEKTQIFRTHKSEAAKKEAELRYEEALPWHLEDADGTNVWVGQYVSALAHTHVSFHVEGHAMRMLPVEKFYKFVSKPNHKTFSIEEVEQLLDKKKMMPNRWIMMGAGQRQEEQDKKETRDLLGGGRRMIKTESSTFRAASRAEKMEHDDLDVSGDEFQDDDETTTFERNNNDEDEKEAKERIRRDQLGAIAFGEADEREMQKELKELEAEAKQLKEFGKSTKKALIKRDQNRIYASDDSEENPWGSSEESSSSEDEEDDKVKKEDDAEKDKSGSRKTSPGKAKPADAGKLKKSQRAGSPAMSESSGNESTRNKKLKAVASSGKNLNSRASTPSLQQKAAKRKAQPGAGSGSDGEATAGEMSDGAGPKKKLKLKPGVSSRMGTPTASRAGSPSPPRAGSPSSGPITPAEILALIPDQGILIGELIQPFKNRLGEGPGQMPRSEWLNMVKTVCRYVDGPDGKKRLHKK
ncbi:Transcription initiation factor IIF subunit alpha-like protein [Emericellopsis cladophorae]|uniref:Transcription initiation factor IIF subunit alpha n=1 Tax=Emericellopsis cladophorae TaxID=2686198 RepID=A0A9Q0BFJ3_9HYPO|nr:Transcription initiation factor IIF subunit alpha-like protein [Emericellopsis cladophorae]KAI6782720.1 Transcription initiation factor IIF subunit alpha-like protein [Emericellopsis cladophorae]